MWDMGKPAIVRAPFDYDGKRYEIGDEFPWKALGCSERLLQTLWQLRKFDWGSIPAELYPAGKSKTFMAKVTPGEHVSIRTPEQVKAEQQRARR